MDVFHPAARSITSALLDRPIEDDGASLGVSEDEDGLSRSDRPLPAGVRSEGRLRPVDEGVD